MKSDVDGSNEKSRPFNRCKTVNEINTDPMIDSSDSARKPAAGRPSSEPPLEEARLRQQAIGVKLRHMFDEVVNEPVPDEFLEILRRADERKAAEDKA